VEIDHFGATPLMAAKPCWKITTADGSVLANGKWEARDILVGRNIPLGCVSVSLASLPAPGACKLVVGLEGTAIENDWNFWLYSTEIASPAPDGLLVSAIPLDKMDPVTRQLHNSLIDYASGDSFQPSAILTPAKADSLFNTVSHPPAAPTSRQFDPDLDDDSGKRGRK
jgi:hypothetical protein